MAARSASLSIRVLVDAAQGASELRQVGDAAGSTTDKLKGMVAAGAAFAGVTAFMKGAVDAASKLQQSSGAVEAVFKGSASAVKQFSSDAATSLGLSKSAYQELATVIGSQLKNAGVAMDQLAPKTQDIITKGADLAAMFGGTTAEAVDALSSALKGERDPIERYGISLNQAAIDAEIMAQGLDTSTTAAKQAATQQATLALINKQSADSMGAAAREANSYASVQQQLNAVWENTMADVGAALLPALSSLGKAFGDLAPAVGTILSPIAQLLGLVLQMPAPLLAAAAAMVGWRVFGGSISQGLSAFVTQLKGAVSSVSGFKASLGSIAGAIGPTLAIGAAVTIIGAFIGKLQEVKQASDEATAAMSTVVDALVKSGGAWDDNARAAQRAAIINSEAFKGLTDAGVSVADTLDILSGNWDKFIEMERNGSQLSGQVTTELEAQVSGMINAGGAAEGLAAKQREANAILEQQQGATQGATAATQEMADAQAKAAEEQAKAALAAAQAAAAQTGVKVALDSVKAAADQASTAVQFFVMQMDLAAGRTPAMDNAAKLLNDTLRDTAGAFQASADKGGINTAALTTWNAAALTSTAEGSSLYDALIKTQTAYATSTVAAYQNAGGSNNSAAAMAAASSAASAAYGAFITMATGAGLSAEQAAQLAAKLGIVQGTQIDPKTFALIAQDQQADKAVSDLQAAKIDPKSVTVNATVAPAQGAFTQLVQQQLANTVKVDANAQAAQGTVNDFVNAKRTTAPVSVPADPSQGNSTVNAFTQAQRSTTPVVVQANTTAAQSAITSLVTQSRTLTITVDANTGPARSAISAVTGGSYTATINVVANTAAAAAAVAAIPRSVTVGAGAAPRLAPADVGLMSARGLGAPAFTPADYPPLRFGARGAATDVGSPVTYEINVSGGLDSSDAIARKVADVLQQRERRVRGVTVTAR